MRNLVWTVMGAVVAMLVTSGVVVLATAKSKTVAPTSRHAQLTEDEIEAAISSLLEEQYQRTVGAKQRAW